MILVIVGTQKQSFKRLLDMVENSEILKQEKIIVQAGYTKFLSNHMETIDFVTPEKLKEYMKQADFVITHGGVGSIFDALEQGKKVIACARLKKYKEHINNHQMEICKKLSDMGYIFYLQEHENLDIAINKTKETVFLPYHKQEGYLEKIRQTINLL